jgi:hypothetical protein
MVGAIHELLLPLFWGLVVHFNEQAYFILNDINQPIDDLDRLGYLRLKPPEA